MPTECDRLHCGDTIGPCDGCPVHPRCEGAGELEEVLGRDSFGNYDTKTWPCPGCPDCTPRLAAFTDDELAGMAYGMRQVPTPMTEALADEVHRERLRRAEGASDVAA